MLWCRLAWLRKDLHVVLVHPQIPQNTGEGSSSDQHAYLGCLLVAPMLSWQDGTVACQPSPCYMHYVETLTLQDTLRRNNC